MTSKRLAVCGWLKLPHVFLDDSDGARLGRCQWPRARVAQCMTSKRLAACGWLKLPHVAGLCGIVLFGLACSFRLGLVVVNGLAHVWHSA